MALTGSPLTLNSGSHSAAKFRQMLKSLFTIPGVAGSTDMLVKQRVSASQGVLVSAGGIWLQGSSSTVQGDYYDFNDADLDVAATAADGAQTRIDRVIYRVRDPDFVAGTPPGTCEWLPGTAGSGVPPTVPVDAVSLAQVARAINGNTLTNAMITDERVYASAAGGAVRNWKQTGPPVTGTYVAGQYGFDIVGAVWFCTVGGTPGTWVEPGGGAWTQYTPTWTASPSNPVIGNGTMLARYRITGKTLYWRLTMVMGSTTTFGSGTWSWSLPGSFTFQGGGSQIGAAVGDNGASATFLNVFGDSGFPTQVRSFFTSANPFAWGNTHHLSGSIVAELA